MKQLSYIVLIIASAFLMSCQRAQVGPSESLVQSELYDILAKANGGENSKDTFSVRNFQVLSVENTGNSVEENIVGRFSATLILNKPVYIVSGEFDNDIKILSEGSKKGTKTPISGTYTSTIKSVRDNSKTWHTTFKFDALDENRWVGRPFAYYSDAVIEGSLEYDEVVIALEKQKQAEEKRRIEAERVFEQQKRMYLDTLEGVWETNSGLNWTSHCENAKSDRTHVHVRLKIEQPIRSEMTVRAELYSPQLDVPSVPYQVEMKLYYGDNLRPPYTHETVTFKPIENVKFTCVNSRSKGGIRTVHSIKEGVGFYGKLKDGKFIVNSTHNWFTGIELKKK